MSLRLAGGAFGGQSKAMMEPNAAADVQQHRWISARVVSRSMVTEDVVCLHLEPLDARIAGMTAGSHIDVELAPGLVRQYSLLNGPAERERLEIAVKREAASRAVHERVSLGDVLKIRGPRNAFALDAETPYSLLVAAGIGITPLLSMARHLSADGRPFKLHHFARSRALAPFRPLLETCDFADHRSRLTIPRRGPRGEGRGLGADFRAEEGGGAALSVRAAGIHGRRAEPGRAALAAGSHPP